MATRTWLLTQNNRELAADGIWTWTLPALSVKRSNGSLFHTCPNADACANLCYARVNSYTFSNVKAAHLRKLEMVLDDPEGWEQLLTVELTHPRYRGANIRVHDSGDFFADWYFAAWVRVAQAHAGQFFYAYTKEVLMVKDWIAENGPLPSNLVVIYSLGGKQDHLIDRHVDRHADVSPTAEAMQAAGYVDQGASDLLAATLPTNRIGIIVNRIPHLVKRQGQQSFGERQAQRVTLRRGRRSEGQAAGDSDASGVVGGPSVLGADATVGVVRQVDGGRA